MCGIIVGKGIEDIKERAKLIKNRGVLPFVYKQHKDITIGHTLLPIRSSVVQPIENDKYILSYNGEIYNTDMISDTEHVLNNISTPEKFKGMFGYVYINKVTDGVIIVRDHLGKIPIYVWGDKDKFLIASELKCFYGLSKPKLLNPATMYNITSGVERKYFVFNTDIIEESKEKIVSNIRMLVENSIKQHMISDIPICIALSGGIDSVVCAYLASKINPKIEAFVCHFGDIIDKRYDIYWARLASKEFGIKLHEVIIPIDTLKKDLDKIIYTCESGSKNQIVSAAGQYYLTKAMNDKGFNVCLTGEMNDENYASYATSARWNYGKEELYIKDRQSLVRNVHRTNLIRTNKMFMSSTVEARIPYGDKDYVNYCLSIPAKYRKERGKMKPLFRLAFPEISQELLWREKSEQGREITNLLHDYKKYIKDKYNELFG